jgi:hypothetical protein
MSTALIDFMFTTAACMSLGMLFVAAVAVLPWREEELDEVSDALGQLAGRATARPVDALRRAA